MICGNCDVSNSIKKKCKLQFFKKQVTQTLWNHVLFVIVGRFAFEAFLSFLSFHPNKQSSVQNSVEGSQMWISPLTTYRFQIGLGDQRYLWIWFRVEKNRSVNRLRRGGSLIQCLFAVRELEKCLKKNYTRSTLKWGGSSIGICINS